MTITEMLTTTISVCIIFWGTFYIITKILDKLSAYQENKRKKLIEARSPKEIYKSVEALLKVVSQIPANDEEVMILLVNIPRYGCVGGVNGKTGSALAQIVKLTNKIIDRCDAKDKEIAKKLIIDAVNKM